MSLDNCMRHLRQYESSTQERWKKALGKQLIKGSAKVRLLEMAEDKILPP